MIYWLFLNPNRGDVVEYEIEDFVGVYKNIIPSELCENAIHEFECLNDMGLTVNRQDGEGTPNHIKNDMQLFEKQIIEARGSACALDIVDAVKMCFSHYKSMFGVLDHYENLGILHYKVQRTGKGGGYHIWHSEDSRHEVSSRLFAFIVYLNDVEEGGETELLYQHRRIKPETGTVLLFPAGFTHTHRGNPPISNTKYIVTGWIEFA